MIAPNLSANHFLQNLVPSSASQPKDHPQAMLSGSIVGDYQIIKVLGQGGFGIVYLARDQALDRDVAIKEFLPVTLAARSQKQEVQPRSPSASKRFLAGLKAFMQEARLLAKFDHPALVKIHHFWEENGTAYMAMPYYEGQTLLAARRMMSHPPTEKWLIDTILALLAGLKLIHQSGFIHRDISPENILVLKNGSVVLLDFAVLPSENNDDADSSENTTILKPAWAPIEQFANTKSLPQGPWTDIYSLGAVAYFCITGKPPPAATVRIIGESSVSGTPLAEALPRLMSLHPGLQYNPFLVSAIDWALAVKPADRPQTAQDWILFLSKIKPEVDNQKTKELSELQQSSELNKVNLNTPEEVKKNQENLNQTQTEKSESKTEIDSSIRDAIGAALSDFDSMFASPKNFSSNSKNSFASVHNNFINKTNKQKLDFHQLTAKEKNISTPIGNDFLKFSSIATKKTFKKNNFGIAIIFLGIILIVSGIWFFINKNKILNTNYYENSIFPEKIEKAQKPEKPEIASAPIIPNTPPNPASIPSNTSNVSTIPNEIDKRAEEAIRQSESLKPENQQKQLIKKPTLREPREIREIRETHDLQTIPAPAIVKKENIPSKNEKDDSETMTDDDNETKNDHELPVNSSNTSPRSVCGARANFALLRCMQTQCQTGRFVLHPQCSYLRRTGEVE
jgi:serine/threonine protein kinase